MGFIHEDRAPGLHCETRVVSTTLYTDFGDQQVEIAVDKLPGAIIALIESYLRHGGYAPVTDAMIRDVKVADLLASDGYVAGIAAISAKRLETEQEEARLRELEAQLPEGYRIVGPPSPSARAQTTPANRERS